MNENNTLLGIANSALCLIGATPLSSLDDANSTHARTVSTLLCLVVDEIQSNSTVPWTELVRDEELVKRGEVGNEIEYNMPSDCLSVDAVLYGGCPVEFRTFGHFLRTYSPADTVRYLRRSMNPSEWSPELKTCVIQLLAARSVAGIVKKYSDSKQLENQFWQVDFPRIVSNRLNVSEPLRKYDYGRKLSSYYQEGDAD